jgi:hypothetical protein
MKNRLGTLALTLLMLAIVSASLTLILTSLSPQPAMGSPENQNPILVANRSCNVTIFTVYHSGSVIVIGNIQPNPNTCGQMGISKTFDRTEQVFLKIVINRMN